MAKSKDKRVLKTEKLILTTFEQMIIEMDYDKITIRELAERAEINRKTFYAHFSCIEDMLDVLADRLAEKFMKNLKETTFFSSVHSAPFIRALTETINQNFELYRKIIVANSYRFFSRNVKDIVKERLAAEPNILTERCTPAEFDFCIEFISSGIAKVYKMWFEDPRGVSEAEIAHLAGSMVFHGLSYLRISAR